MKYTLHDDWVTLTITVDDTDDEKDICLIDLDTALGLLTKATLKFNNPYQKRLRECDPL